MTSKKVDFIIVGQGLAGTLVAWFLEKEKQSFIIIDDGHKHAASKVAAGIINPITGRRFVKSWLIETLWPFAKETYQEIEKTTNLALYQDLEIIRFFQSTAEENNWLAKTSYENYDRYLNDNASLNTCSASLKHLYGYGGVYGAKMDISKLVAYFRDYHISKKRLLTESFDYQALTINAATVNYKGITADKILFCEGHAAHKNPWFSNLPFESAKGEILIVEMPNFKTDKILKNTQFLVPLEKDNFWFGSNYEWDNLTNNITTEERLRLENQLKTFILTEYKVIEQKAAIRPVLKDRRPVLGLHYQYPQIGIFNGLGTKGTSIGPFFAHTLVNFYCTKKK